MIASVVADVKRAGYTPSSSMMARPTRQVPSPLKPVVWCCDIPINLGTGAGLSNRHRIRRKPGGADVIVTFDADGQGGAADIAVLIDALARQGADFALGSQLLGTSLNQPLSRRMLLKAATLFTRLTTGLRVTDTHNGLRAMTRRGASSINLRQNRMAHASDNSSPDRCQRTRLRRSACEDRVQRLFARQRSNARRHTR